MFLIGNHGHGYFISKNFVRNLADDCHYLFGTTAYHFIMRWVVAFIYNFIMHNRADYRKRWYQVSKSEMKLYEKLRVKKWKNRMPTYNPSLFDPRQHTWEEIAQVTCQAELGHETIADAQLCTDSGRPLAADIRHLSLHRSLRPCLI